MAAATAAQSVNIYLVSNYTIGDKEPKFDKYNSVDDRLTHLKVK